MLLLGGQTLNMLSMFAFLMALGIVVDDAIVVGENIYAHRQLGKNFTRAAIDGTFEVMPSVVASVTTTVIAFCPLFFVSGIMGKFIAVMPFAVIAMLVISLLESLFVLPCHLAHRDSLLFQVIGILFYPFRFLARFHEFVNRWAGAGLQSFSDRVYVPALHWCVRNKWIATASAFAVLIAAFGFIRGGFVPFVVFPKIDSNYLQVKLAFPDGTPSAVADATTSEIVAALQRVDRHYQEEGGPSVLQVVHRNIGQTANDQGGMTWGSHVGSIDVELLDTSQRTITSQQITADWRDETGEIAGVESLSFGTVSFGPGGQPIEFKLQADAARVRQLEEAVEKCKEKLATYPGVFDVDDDSRPGKWELQIRIKDRAQSMGINTADLAETIRASYYGAEVMRLQRGRHEVKLMVRYPEEERRSLADFQDIRVRTGDGQERPLTELAEVTVVRGYSEINRVNQLRSITVNADLDEATGNARNIVADLQDNFMPGLLAEYPGVSVRWEGQQEQTQESLSSLMFATAVALMVMFVLLTLEFRSYVQPLLIMLIIPFGLIGAVAGHAIMGLPITLFSFFGLVALTGVVVNDSIVMIDFINHRVRDGLPIEEALVDAGRRRLRPVLLTSATTIAGLFPILIETSFQAQILIPMATSLSFGLLVSTVLVLLLVPTVYRIYYIFVAVKPGDTIRDEEYLEQNLEAVASDVLIEAQGLLPPMPCPLPKTRWHLPLTAPQRTCQRVR